METQHPYCDRDYRSSRPVGSQFLESWIPRAGSDRSIASVSDAKLSGLCDLLRPVRIFSVKLGFMGWHPLVSQIADRCGCCPTLDLFSGKGQEHLPYRAG